MSSNPTSEWNFVVFGANGFLGTALLNHGLTQNYRHVIGVSRQPFSLKGSTNILFNNFNELKPKLSIINFAYPTVVAITIGKWNGTADELIHSNLLLPIKIGSLLAQLMDKGLILFFGDSRTSRPLKEGHIAYYAGKSGLEGAMRTMAIKFAPQIRVNLLSLGPLNTITSNPKSINLWKNKLLVNDFGGIKPIIDAIEFIRKNEFITGSVFNIDGGFSLT